MNPKNALLFFGILAVVGVGFLFIKIFGPDKAPTVRSSKATSTVQVAVKTTSTGPSFWQKLFAPPQSYQAVSGGDNREQAYPGTQSEAKTPEQVEYELNQAKLSAEQIQKNLDALKAEKEASPFKGKVYIESGGPSGYADPLYETITLRANYYGKENITITGWQLESKSRGIKIKIGTAAKLPFQGQTSYNDKIVLLPGQSAIIITGKSPSGYSFEVNKCSGYLKEAGNVYPYIYQRCPYIVNEGLPEGPNELSYECVRYLRSLPSCFRSLADVSYSLGPSCQTYINEKANYMYCVNHHKNDKDFYNGDWRIYLERDQKLWRNYNETIRLLDENDKLIQELKYY